MVVFAARVLLGTIFLLAGLAKMRDQHSLTADVEAFTRLPPGFARLVASGLPVLEVVLAVLLLAGLVPVIAFGLTTAVLLAFTAVVMLNVAAGRRVSCACFGSSRNGPVGPSTVVRNLALVAAAALGLVLSMHRVEPLSVAAPGQLIPVVIATLAGLLIMVAATAAWRIHRSLRRLPIREIPS